MKVLFLNAPWFTVDTENNHLRKGIRAGSRWPHTIPAVSHPDTFTFGVYSPMPQFLAYAATYCQKHVTGSEVHFRDSIALHESYTKFAQYLNVLRPDFIVFESGTPCWNHDATLIKAIAKVLPETKFIVVGTVTSELAPSILADHPNVIACVKGEYEKGVVKVLGGARGIIEHDLLTEAEMNAQPFPWFDSLHSYNYADGCPAGAVFPHVQVWSSRGCPYKCCFCIWPAFMTGNDPDGLHKRTVRFYSADYMEAYLREIVGKYGFKSIYFDDDTFNLSNKHTLAMCGVMRKIGLPWSAMCRADTSTREVWQEMKDSGCYGVKLGFESGSQRVIDKIINKKLDLKEALETGRFLTSIGINWHGTFTVGLPGETEAEREETKRFIEACIDAGMSTHQVSGTAVIEGTPLSTLGRVGSLSAYPDAKIDETFSAETDGVLKAQQLSKKQIQ